MVHVDTPGVIFTLICSLDTMQSATAAITMCRSSQASVLHRRTWSASVGMIVTVANILNIYSNSLK